MNIKDRQAQIKATEHRIWLHSQYLTTLGEQKAALYAATPATRRRTEARIDATKAGLETEAARLLDQTNAMFRTIDAIDDPRLQEILTRRYLKNQPFAAIAEEMNYDLRWVYRLHHQGLMLSEFETPARLEKSL